MSARLTFVLSVLMAVGLATAACGPTVSPDGAPRAGSASPVATGGGLAAPPNASSAPGGHQAAQEISLHAACQLVSQRSVKLKSQLPGEIESVSVEQGEVVRPGQVLARLRQDELQLEWSRLSALRQQAQARVALLEHQLTRARRERDAVQALYAPGQAEHGRESLLVKEREMELQQAQSAVTVAEIDLAATRRRLAQTAIVSPMHGVVLARHAERGMVTGSGLSSVTGSDVLFEIGDPEQLRAECSARPQDAALLRVGQPLHLQLDGLEPAQDVRLRITRVAPAVSQQGGASFLSFWGDFRRPQGAKLLPGMQGQARIDLSNGDRHEQAASAP